MKETTPLHAEMQRLRKMRWSSLERIAFEAGISIGEVQRHAKIDDLRHAILAKKFPHLETGKANA